MSAGIALWRSAACEDVASAGGTGSAQAQRKGLPDKRPGTVARHAVVFGAPSPCQRKDIRAGQSGNPLNRGTLCRAEGFILGRKQGVQQTTSRQPTGPTSPSASLPAPHFSYSPNRLRPVASGSHARLMSKAGRTPPVQDGPAASAAAQADMRADPRRAVPTALREHPDPAILKLARALARQAAREDHARDVQG